MSATKAIIAAGGFGTRMYPCTFAMSKHLLPVYNKPMIYYPITTLMQVGVRDILLVSHHDELPLYQALLKDGSQWGINIRYLGQPKGEGIVKAMTLAKQFIASDSFIVMLGDNFFDGDLFIAAFPAVLNLPEGVQLFALQVQAPESFGVIAFDAKGMPTQLIEKPKTPASNWAVPGCYVYTPQVLSVIADLDPAGNHPPTITDINAFYLAQEKCRVMQLDESVTWFDMGTHNSLHQAACYVFEQVTRHNRFVGVPEVVARAQGLIDQTQFFTLAKNMQASTYGQRLLTIG